jgi:Secretion system C-terminal sorting domain
MKKYSTHLLLVAFLLMAFQSFSQEKRQYIPKKEKTLKLQAQEKEVQQFISEKLNGYKLAPEREVAVRRNFEKVKPGRLDAGKGTLDNLLLEVKKYELRKLYYEKHSPAGYRTTTKEETEVGYICDNGGFEDGITDDYEFIYLPVSEAYFDCEMPNFWGSTGSPPANTVNATTENATLVDNDLAVSNGNDPLLESIGIHIPRVHNGDFAMKLNGDMTEVIPDAYVAGSTLTTMSKEFIADSDFVSYWFSLIVESSVGHDSSEQPYFIVRLYDSDNNIVAWDCITPGDDPLLFQDGGAIFPHFGPPPTYTGNYNASLLYTGWQCGYLSAELLEENEVARLEFIITDCSDGAHYGTVYIDDICNTSCEPDPECPDCPELHGDIPSGTDEVQAFECIHAYNTISSGATALYYAGHNEGNHLVGEIVLLPSDEIDTTGFECLSGSIGHFYIEACPAGEFTERNAMQLNEQPKTKLGSLQIFPNPADSELNIVSSDASLKAIRMISLDGKLVLERQPGADSSKNIKLDVNELSSGIYILTVETVDGAVTTHKIVRE